MGKPRFSKKSLVQDLLDKIENIQKQYHFDLSDGTSQLWPSPGSTTYQIRDSIDKAAAYGKLRAYQTILEDATA